MPLGYFLFLTFPFSFAYAILRHRLFDIRLMVRQGVQYALARRLLLSLVPALAGFLLLDLLLHGDQPFLLILRARGWIYGGLIGLALLAHRQRERWMDALDQRFFRERYSAEKLLREMVEEIREATSLERVAPRLVARIEAALHPEFVALLVREPQASSYRTLAIAPEGKALPNMAADSKLTALVRLLGKPLEYMSPEQLRGEPVNSSWDIWALAVMAYQMLTGAHPFGDASFAECHAAVLAGRFRPIAQYLPAAPARYEGFFRKVFAVDATQRPAAVGDFFSELQDALQPSN